MISVIIVTYNSEDVIEDCLDSLIASKGEALCLLIFDNSSTDKTIETIRRWSIVRDFNVEELTVQSLTYQVPGHALIKSDVNIGFAGGVNRALNLAIKDEKSDLFWILNPDCVVEPTTALAFRKCANAVGSFSLMGSRILYHEPPNLIQSDGGRVGHWTGICRNANQGANPETAVRPEASDLDFISGANMVASRHFIETVGLMREDYFLYFEEVEWAARRGMLPLVLCEEAIVHHHGGTAIGTGSVTRRASPFAHYFNYRNRMRFLARVRPLALPVSCAASLARIMKLALQRAWPEAWAALLGLCQLPPSKTVRSILSEDAAEYAFGSRWKRHD